MELIRSVERLNQPMSKETAEDAESTERIRKKSEEALRSVSSDS